MKTCLSLYTFIDIPTEWLKDDSNLIQSEERRVSKEDIAGFRKGNYKDAPKHIKTKWLMVMLVLLPCINSNYTKKVRASELARDFTCVSDEALVLWHLLVYGPTWEKEAEEGTKKKTGKQTGEHYSKTEWDLYCVTHAGIQEARDHPETAVGWDEAVKAEAICQLTKGKGDCSFLGVNEEQVDGIPASLKQVTTTSYVMRYSPGKAARVQKRSIGMLYEEV